MPIDPLSIPTARTDNSQPDQPDTESAGDIGKQYIDKVRANLPPFGPDTYLPPERVTYTQGYTVERYVRVNVTKNTKGYNTDTTVSVTSTAPLGKIENEMRDLLILAGSLAEDEIQRQKLEALESYEDRGN